MICVTALPCKLLTKYTCLLTHYLTESSTELLFFRFNKLTIVVFVARNMIGYWQDNVVYPSVRPSVTLCTVATRYMLQQKRLNK